MKRWGLPLRLIPRRIFYVWRATASATLRSNWPLAVEPEIVTFVYADPGHQTHTELHAWGAAHGPLWDALRKKGRQVAWSELPLKMPSWTGRIECLKMGGGSVRDKP